MGNRLEIYTKRTIFNPELLAGANDSTVSQKCFSLINSKDFTKSVSELKLHDKPDGWTWGKETSNFLESGEREAH